MICWRRSFCIRRIMLCDLSVDEVKKKEGGVLFCFVLFCFIFRDTFTFTCLDVYDCAGYPLCFLVVLGNS